MDLQEWKPCGTCHNTVTTGFPVNSLTHRSNPGLNCLGQHILLAQNSHTCLGKMMSEILKIGIPTLVFQLLTSLSMGSLMVFGFLKGFQPIAGYSYGAGKYDRLREVIKTSVLWSTLFCAFFGLTAALFSARIMSQFTRNDLEMIRTGQKFLTTNGLSFALFGFYTVYSFLFLVMGKAKEGCILGACRQGICFVPVILVLPAVMGLNGILYAQPAADVLSAIVTILMASRLHRELNAAEKRSSMPSPEG